ncbi:hypothetical protein Mgra_00010021, partial [Meloidogyne graminicola]
MGGDFGLLVTLCISAPLYTAVLTKFIYDYKNKKMAGLDEKALKDRIIVLAICLASLIPLPILLGLYKLSQYFNDNIQSTLPSIIFITVYNFS